MSDGDGAVMVTMKPLQNLKREPRGFWFLAGVMAVLALPASGMAADAGAAKRYEVPERGFLQLSVPAGWTDKYENTSQPPLISFRPGQGQPFLVSLTPAWPTDAGKPAASNEDLRKSVVDLADGIRLFAIEKDIKVIEFAGRTGPGFYFFATDAAPAPGEFKFMNRGMLKVGDLTVTFTILTNEGQDAVVRAALEMLKGAVYEAR
jgi:hypothetical protein